GTGWILIVTNGCELRRDGRPLRAALLSHFIADAPHYYTGMIAISSKQSAQVLLVPVTVKHVIVRRSLLALPYIECLVHYEKTHFVGKIQQLRRWRIVAGSDRIAAHIGQYLQLALQSSVVNRRAQRPQVVMVADAVDLDVLSI